MSRVLPLLLLLLLCLSSCATLSPSKYQLSIKSSKKNIKINVQGDTYTLPANVIVKHSRLPLPITIIADTISRQDSIKPVLSPSFLYGNLLFAGIAPLGYVTDLFSEKRFYYGKRLIIDDGLSIQRQKWHETVGDYFISGNFGTKGQLNFTFGIPYGNLYFMRPDKLPVQKGGGFFGIEAGVEYYYSNRKFLKFNAATAIDFPFPVPAPYTIDGAYTTLRAKNFTITNNHTFYRNTIGYGVAYNIYTWAYHNNGEGRHPHNNSRKDSHAFGLNLSLHHHFSENFSLGAAYSPTVFTTFPETGFQYQHLITIDFQFRVTLYRPAVKRLLP